MVKVQRIRDREMLSSKYDISTMPSLPKVQESLLKRLQKDCKSQRQWVITRKQFQIQKRAWMWPHMLTKLQDATYP